MPKVKKSTHLIRKRLFKTQFIGKMLIRLPFVRCVILNGSLAKDKSKESSDIDILIIAKSGRIFSGRFFVNAFSMILGIKRSKDEKKSHAGKFCFNYFLTEDYLKIPTGRGEKIDKYCAENYSQSKFVAGDYYLFKKFLKTNEQLFHRYGFHSNLSFPPKREPKKLLKIYRTMSWCGDLFESWAKSYQIKKIESDTRTKRYPNLISYNDKELRFHPPKSP